MIRGRLGLRSVVDSAIFVIAGDTNINVYFHTLLMNLTDFFCVATGARHFTYSGKNMHDAHDPATNPRMNGKAANDEFCTVTGSSEVAFLAVIFKTPPYGGVFVMKK